MHLYLLETACLYGVQSARLIREVELIEACKSHTGSQKHTTPQGGNSTAARSKEAQIQEYYLIVQGNIKPRQSIGTKMSCLVQL